jgi:arsenate reductase (thioredoxin)
MMRPFRLSMMVAMVAIPLIAVAVVLLSATRTPTPTVLFLCPHGAAKSVLASAYFTQLAAERGLRVRVEAAGTEPAPAVSPAVAARLAQQGLTVPIDKPRTVTTADVADADIVISIGCDTSKIPPTDKLRRWDDVPDTSADFPAADQALRAKAQALVDEISRLSHSHRE